MVTKTSHLPIRYFLALLWAHPILHVSRIRVKTKNTVHLYIDLSDISIRKSHTKFYVEINIYRQSYILRGITFMEQLTWYQSFLAVWNKNVLHRNTKIRSTS